MMDALALAVEEGVDAIVDIATLTGAVLVALGAVDGRAVRQRPRAARSAQGGGRRSPTSRSGSCRWRRSTASSSTPRSPTSPTSVAPSPGSTTAALFLSEFVGDTPWAHVDIAGTMQVDADEAWRSKGATGFGARLLAEVARGLPGRRLSARYSAMTSRVCTVGSAA